jgi:transaldolase
MTATDLKIKVFADGADLSVMRTLSENPRVSGFTTNPTLMRSAGVSDYKSFAREVLAAIPDKPISFEVFADDFPTMERQAREIATWGKNANVKIPATNTKGESSAPLIARLSGDGIVLNITALFTVDRVKEVAAVLDAKTPAILSVFAGRLADVGIDPIPVMREAVAVAAPKPKAEVLWASTREVFNVFEAQRVGCHIITAPEGVIKKLSGLGTTAEELAIDAVRVFYRDAQAAGYDIEVGN